MKSISVVIPNYNGRTLLKQNLPFVYRALKTSNIIDSEIIISDDASIDESVLFIKENYPKIILIENKKNRGFASNVNAGMRVASKDLIFILNSDVKLTNAYFSFLLPYFEKANTFGVMGQIVDMNSNRIIDGAKYPAYSFGSIVSAKNYVSKKSSSYFSFFLSGANALVDRKKISKIGIFNELFDPYYFEDVDLGLRAWRMGYKIYYEHNAVCKHSTSETIKKESVRNVKIIAKRNKFYLHYLHFDGVELLFFLITLFFKALFRLFIFDIKYIKSFAQFIKTIKKLEQSKKVFKTIQKENETNLNIRKIAKKIKAEINKLDVEIF